MASTVLFSATDLSSGSYRTRKTDAFNAPVKETNIADLARRNGSVYLFDRIKGRKIVVDGHMMADSAIALKGAMDALKALLLTGKSPLRITEDGEYREWESVVLVNVNFGRDSTSITYATFSVEFFSENPYAIDGTTDTLVNQVGHTAATGSFALSSGGSYYAQPDITITLTAINPTTSPVDITIGNPATSQSLTIRETFATGDVITINTKRNQVFRNAELISAEGQFPAWLPGSGALEYSDSATTRTVSISATNSRKWL